MPHDPILTIPPYTISPAGRALSETIDWGLAMTGVPAVWAQTKGAGIRVAVLDTGIDATHPDLAHAVADSRDFTGSGEYDHQGHGTHCAGVIGARANGVGLIGVAPACVLGSGKVLDNFGIGRPEWLAAGIRWAVRDFGADIISMSLGSPQAMNEVIDEIMDAVSRTGRQPFFFCAAGNDGASGSVNFPAWMEQTIAVGAVDKYGNVAEFSARGDAVDVAAPGKEVTSTYPHNSYATLSGTSMATPFAVGAGALMLAKHRDSGGESPIMTYQDLRKHFAWTCRDLGPTGKDPSFGWGLINPAKLLEPPPPALAPAPPATCPPAPTPIPGGNWILLPSNTWVWRPEGVN